MSLQTNHNSGISLTQTFFLGPFLSFLLVVLTRLATTMHRVLELGSWGDQGSPTDNAMPAPIKGAGSPSKSIPCASPCADRLAQTRSLTLPCTSPTSISAVGGCWPVMKFLEASRPLAALLTEFDNSNNWDEHWFVTLISFMVAKIGITEVGAETGFRSSCWTVTIFGQEIGKQTGFVTSQRVTATSQLGKPWESDQTRGADKSRLESTRQPAEQPTKHPATRGYRCHWGAESSNTVLICWQGSTLFVTKDTEGKPITIGFVSGLVVPSHTKLEIGRITPFESTPNGWNLTVELEKHQTSSYKKSWTS